jgi:predicted DNA-binding transcriptional regulator AlpA
MRLDTSDLNRNPLPTSFDSDRVVAPKEVAALLGISIATLRRMWARGEGPRWVRLSLRRQGCRLRDLNDFLASR